MVRTFVSQMRRSAAVVGAVVLGSLTLSAFAAELYPKRAPQKRGAPTGQQLVTMLDQVLQEQQELLQIIEDVKAELAIVKVRANLIQRGS